MMSQTPRLLFVDDDAQLVDVLARQARAAGYEVFTAHNAWTALNAVEKQVLDLICLDVDVPTGSGLSLAEMLSSTVAARGVPIVVLTGLTDEATQQRCARLGAHYLAKGRDTWPRLKARLIELLGPAPDETSQDIGRSQAITELVFQMLGAGESFLDSPAIPAAEAFDAQGSDAGPWVLCVDDDRDFSLALELKLKRHGISVVRALDGVEGVQSAFTRPAEAILLDYNLPNGRGDYVLRRLKTNPLTRDIPVIVISGQKQPGLEKEMLHLGAVRFFAKPARFEELLEELQRHVRVTA